MTQKSEDGGGEETAPPIRVFLAPSLIIIEIISQKGVFFGKNAIREGAKKTKRGCSANNGDVGSFQFLKLILGGEYENSFFGRGV